MGKGQRVKGSVFEREVAAKFSAALGQTFKRNIGQARDGGNDIDAGRYVVECKRRKTLTTVRSWFTQAEKAAVERMWRAASAQMRDAPVVSHQTTLAPLTNPLAHIPVVVMRDDNQPKALVMLELDDFLEIAKRAEGQF